MLKIPHIKAFPPIPLRIKTLFPATPKRKAGKVFLLSRPLLKSPDQSVVTNLLSISSSVHGVTSGSNSIGVKIGLP